MSQLLPALYLVLGFAAGLYVRSLWNRIGKLSASLLNYIYKDKYASKLQETIPGLTSIQDHWKDQ